MFLEFNFQNNLHAFQMKHFTTAKFHVTKEIKIKKKIFLLVNNSNLPSIRGTIERL